MARVVSETKTKTANTKTKSKTNADGTEKTKCAPTAYNLFVSRQLKKWKEEILDKPYKEGMSAVALLWADTASPLSSTRPRPKQPKEKATKSKPKTKPKKAVHVEEEEDNEDESENEIPTTN
ncbi:hypothetical protein B0H14DRAFT_3674294 [Mycena olivaceomarginata]|nr:hypothetical protein B0H14DRAFT_3674294 [Mycena olivaceomarginata]